MPEKTEELVKSEQLGVIYTISDPFGYRVLFAFDRPLKLSMATTKLTRPVQLYTL